jgi:hypothetical protein
MHLRWGWTKLLLAAFAVWPSTLLAETWELTVPTHILIMHDSVASATQGCKIPARTGEGYLAVRGCWDKVNRTLHIQRVTDFCDASALNTAGHEYLHVMGFLHSADHQPSLTLETGCGKGAFTQ